METIRPGLLHTHKNYLLCLFLISLKCYEVKGKGEGDFIKRGKGKDNQYAINFKYTYTRLNVLIDFSMS